MDIQICQLTSESQNQEVGISTFKSSIIKLNMSEKKLKVVITTSGSRGEVQPYVALGVSLNSRGHDVTVATEERVKSIVLEYGLNYKPLVGDPTGLLFDADSNVSEILTQGQMMKLISLTESWEKKFDMNDILMSYVSACEGADLIISGQLTMTQSYSVAEMMNCPWVPMILGPTLPTRCVIIA